MNGNETSSIPLHEPAAEPSIETTDSVVNPVPAKASPSRTVSIMIAVMFLAIPTIYFVVRTFGNRQTVLAGQSAPVPVAAQVEVPALEVLVQREPTAANRINLSLAYINSGASARALPVLLSVVAEDKTNKIAWNDLCVAHTLLGDYATAMDECNQSLTIDPYYQLARNNLNWASQEKDKTLAVIRTDDKTAAVHDAAFYLAQGMNQIHVGDYDQAIVSWKHTLQLDPTSALAANNIGTAFMMKKHPNVAVAWFDKALALDPNLQLAKNNLAWAHQEEQRPTR